MKKKKTTTIIERGRLYITATFNNTLVTITDEGGSPVVVGSAGMHGFAGTRKSTPYAATITTENALRKAIEIHGLKSVSVFVKGIGAGREAALRAIKAANVDVSEIADITPIPHNGVRPPNVRRV